jgi:hypothetical protein
MLKTSEYGVTNVWHMDSHQIANVTSLGAEHWRDVIDYKVRWLLFPAWRHVKSRGRSLFARPVVQLNVVCEGYLKERIGMQLRTCRQQKNIGKELFLSVRRSVWDNVEQGESREVRWLMGVEAERRLVIEQTERVWQARMQQQRVEEERR